MTPTTLYDIHPSSARHLIVTETCHDPDVPSVHRGDILGLLGRLQTTYSLCLSLNLIPSFGKILSQSAWLSKGNSSNARIWRKLALGHFVQLSPGSQSILTLSSFAVVEMSRYIVDCNKARRLSRETTRTDLPQGIEGEMDSKSPENE